MPSVSVIVPGEKQVMDGPDKYKGFVLAEEANAVLYLEALIAAEQGSRVMLD